MAHKLAAKRQSLETGIAERKLAQARAQKLQCRQELTLEKLAGVHQENVGDDLPGLDAGSRVASPTRPAPACSPMLMRRGRHGGIHRPRVSG